MDAPSIDLDLLTTVLGQKELAVLLAAARIQALERALAAAEAAVPSTDDASVAGSDEPAAN